MPDKTTPKLTVSYTGDTVGHIIGQTEYVILRQQITTPSGNPSATEKWDRAGTVKARSAEHAIRVHADKGKITDGVYVAIPKRSFSPCTVKEHTTTSLKIVPA